MPFVTSTDVASEQAKVKGQYDAIWTAYQAKLSDGWIPPLATQASAHGLTLRVANYLAESPSLWRAAAQMDEGQALERDLDAFSKQLAAAGVQDLPPSASVPPASPGILPLLGGVVDALPLVLVVLLVRELHSK